MSLKNARAIAVLSLIALIGFAAWLFLPSLACPVPDMLLSDEQLKRVLDQDLRKQLARPNCVEFWLNRYQSLIGAFAAIGAAWYAGNWVRQQIKKSDEQLALMQAQLASERTPLMNERLHNSKKAHQAFTKVGQFFIEGSESFSNAASLYDRISNDPEYYKNVYIRTSDVIGSADAIERRRLDVFQDDLKSARKSFVEAIDSIEAYLQSISGGQLDEKITRMSTDVACKARRLSRRYLRACEAVEHFRRQLDGGNLSSINHSAIAREIEHLSIIDDISFDLVASEFTAEISRLHRLRDKIVANSDQLVAGGLED